MSETKSTEKDKTAEEWVSRFADKDFADFMPEANPPALRVLQAAYSRDVKDSVLERLFAKQQAPDSFIAKQNKYLASLPEDHQEAIRHLIESTIGVQGYRHYWVKFGSLRWAAEILSKDKAFSFKKYARSDMKRNELEYAKALKLHALVQDAILKAPTLSKPLILYHGQNDMQPFVRFGSTYPASYQLKRGEIAVLPTFISSDNNLTLSIYGRGGAGGGYWSVFDACCLWRIHVPSGFPVLFVEERYHVLLPAGTVVRIMGKKTLALPFVHHGEPSRRLLLMYDVQVIDLAQNALPLLPSGRLAHSKQTLSRDII